MGIFGAFLEGITLGLYDNMAAEAEEERDQELEKLKHDLRKQEIL